jgi:FixJ family two-component response regulator
MVATSRFIAVVDDDTSILKALERLLSARSWVTKTYRSGRQFLSSLNDELPGCLILDLHMPEMSGLEVQETLINRGIEIPTIIITSNTDAAMRERCMVAGAVAYLPKPVRRADLFAAIDAASAGGSD